MTSRNPKSMRAYFTGVVPGELTSHVCRRPNFERDDLLGTPWCSPFIRYSLLDWHPYRDGLFPGARGGRSTTAPPVAQQEEGVFVRVLVARLAATVRVSSDWTMLAAWDRSADQRGGCTATFAFEGERDGEEALRLARTLFPGVLERIEAHVGRPVCVEDVDPTRLPRER